MSKTAPKHTLAASLERIQALLSELRQTEALEAQVHEMVVMKRQRLDALMSDHMQLALESAESPAPAPAPIPAPEPIAVVEDLPLSPHGSFGAPKDLLQDKPAPSAQHVLDSLNRLMTGMKGISAKQASAA